MFDLRFPLLKPSYQQKILQGRSLQTACAGAAVSGEDHYDGSCESNKDDKNNSEDDHDADTAGYDDDDDDGEDDDDDDDDDEDGDGDGGDGGYDDGGGGGGGGRGGSDCVDMPGIEI